MEIEQDAAKNLAIDEAIFQARIEKSVPPTLRFWRNDRVVIIGRSQKVCAEVNLEICIREKIQVVKRFSGGGAVYHDLGNLNYTIVLDADDRLIKGLDISESYRVLCSGIIRGLEILGLSSVRFIPPGNIFVNGKKISGSAQLRRKNVVLHHGTLLVSSDLNMLKKALAVFNDEADRSTSTRSPVTRLIDELNHEVSMSEVKNTLLQGFKEELGIRLEPGGLTELENEFASRIYYAKYFFKRETFGTAGLESGKI
ncbi:MAG: lipoate--protein ligase family protein [Candidatus Bathyarchaeota archaeon]|nr:lipoate--protein ligase family protein [Candidatus Bathyarchaeota archaeon]